MIRAYKAKDLSSCAKMLVDAYNGEPWNNHWTEETATRYLSEFIDAKNFVGFVAEEEGQLVGVMFGHRKTWWTSDEILIDELFIHSDFQRQGYGEALLSHMEGYCQENELAGLVLLTNPFMPAKDFYEKNGFTYGNHVAFYYKEV